MEVDVTAISISTTKGNTWIHHGDFTIISFCRSIHLGQKLETERRNPGCIHCMLVAHPVMPTRMSTSWYLHWDAGCLGLMAATREEMGYWNTHYYFCPEGTNWIGSLWLTLPVLRLLSSNAQGCKDLWNHRNPVMLVLIGKISLSTLRWVPICQGFSDFSGFLHYFVLANLATSSIRVNDFNRVFLSYKLACIPFKSHIFW